MTGRLTSDVLGISERGTEYTEPSLSSTLYSTLSLPRLLALISTSNLAGSPLALS